jgi:transcriptional regulator with XRE-family HTH domain
MTPLAHMLKLYRASRDIGVREMGAAIGISAATISRIERGGSMDLPTWQKIQDWLLK